MDLKNSRYLRQNSDLRPTIRAEKRALGVVWTMTMVVLAVANISAEMRASLTKADNRGTVQSHGGTGEG